MEYISTRGGTGAVDFEGALFSGYAPDGGLFMPSCIPWLDRPTLQQWSHLSYPELVKEICFLFVKPELIPRGTLSDLIDRAFSKFRHEDVVHLSRLKDGLNILELWHGVTYAFKDLSLSCTGQFLQYFLEKKQKHVNVLVVHGNSDEIDEPIKELFADVDFARRNNLMSLNSVNWSRIMVQIAHYFYAYFRCTPTLDSTTLPVVEIVVPTGGGGNVTAGCIAQKMGLPIQLVAAVNSNDIIHRTVKDGDFSLSGRVKATLASAMDIQEPYNVERILWLLSGSDSHLTKTLMEQFTVSKSLKLPEDLHRKVSETLRSCSASDEDIVQAMQRCWEENHYLLCPHSAVAAHYHYSHLDSCASSTPRCCLAPASAAKFQDAVLRAGLVPEIPPEITALTAMETRSTVLQRGEDWARVIRDHITAVEQWWGKQGAALTSPGQQGVNGQA
ncbi:threonine synthase-like 2 isoform X2 [Tympanuchus pallidicinctus]|uniref:threonine synthase-like 2 isoform X2 n=1 Tax=Tympanuchus pallidicinctus TaxID=109042 RepID=UPI0022871D50|nr:threonine synthase-like 2 isoform X2 [Tympanuchus pallidicinctus]